MKSGIQTITATTTGMLYNIKELGIDFFLKHLFIYFFNKLKYIFCVTMPNYYFVGASTKKELKNKSFLR